MPSLELLLTATVVCRAGSGWVIYRSATPQAQRDLHPECRHLVHHAGGTSSYSIPQHAPLRSSHRSYLGTRHVGN
jgi:hypothetical protein